MSKEKIKFKACENLIFDKSKIDKRCSIVSLGDNVGAYWDRSECDPSFPHVQFCSKRGRLYGKVTCLKGMAECSLYVDAEFSLYVDKEKNGKKF